MDGKISLKDQRERKLSGLRNNVGQATAWQNQLIELLDELNHDNLLLRRGHLQLKCDMDELKTNNGLNKNMT